MTIPNLLPTPPVQDSVQVSISKVPEMIAEINVR